jgi:hypothetical protein
MSGKTSETGKRKLKQDAQTFENDSILGTPEVAEIFRVLISHNTYKTWSISKNMELVSMPKIFSWFNFDSLRRLKFNSTISLEGSDCH